MSSNTDKLNNLLEAQAVFNDAPVPLGFGFYNSALDKVEYIAPVKEFTIEDLKKAFPIK